MKRIKNNKIDLSGLSNQMIIAWDVLETILSAYGVDAICTCGREGEHSYTSLHYVGKALDFRSYELNKEEQEEVRIAFTIALSIDFDFVVEENHFHIEYQPKFKK